MESRALDGSSQRLPVSVLNVFAGSGNPQGEEQVFLDLTRRYGV